MKCTDCGWISMDDKRKNCPNCGGDFMRDDKSWESWNAPSVNLPKQKRNKLYVYTDDGGCVCYTLYSAGSLMGTYNVDSAMDRLGGIEIHELDESRAPMNYINKDFIHSRLRKYTSSSQETSSAMPKSEVVSPGIDQIPFEFIEALGSIFAEGEAKYGKDNWKQSPNDAGYNQERSRHALRHLMLWIGGDRKENHLAKVAWFCCTTIWREKHATDRT
jgi:hypothetical protein